MVMPARVFLFVGANEHPWAPYLRKVDWAEDKILTGRAAWWWLQPAALELVQGQGVEVLFHRSDRRLNRLRRPRTSTPDDSSIDACEHVDSAPDTCVTAEVDCHHSEVHQVPEKCSRMVSGTAFVVISI